MNGTYFPVKYQDDISGVTAGHDSVQMSVDVICPAFPHQLVGGHSIETCQGLCMKPCIGQQVGAGVA